ncbi:hypothetical protein BH10ACI2_BH10ACI2_02540 [soil metagenome]
MFRGICRVPRCDRRDFPVSGLSFRVIRVVRGQIIFLTTERTEFTKQIRITYKRSIWTIHRSRIKSDWIRGYGQGRVFYTALGHRADIWNPDPTLKDRKNPPVTAKAFRQHVLTGILWALRSGAKTN